MANVTGGGSNDKLNFELNLVPFIDLLSTLVLFLLVTAVWLQISAIPASVDSKGRKLASTPPENRIGVHLTTSGLNLTWPKGTTGPRSLPRAAQGYDLDKLVVALTAAQQTGKTSAAAVSADDNVEYGAVVQAIDSVKTAGLTAVGIRTN